MRQGQFRKGNIPWNSGMHPRMWMNKEEYKRFQSTQFKKGQTPWNKGKIGIYSGESLEKMSESKRGHIPWNKGRKIRTHPSNCKCNLCKIIRGELPPWNKGKPGPRGMENPMFGKHQTKESKEKNSLAHKLLWENPIYRQRMLEKLKDPKMRMKISEALRGRKLPETHQRNVLKSLFKRPTKLEQKFMRIIEKNGLPFKYVGDGKIIVEGKCPDFIDCDGSKRVVEVFGRIWHDPEYSFKEEVPYHQTEQGTIEHYAKYGFKCIVLWEDELDNEELVLSKIRGGKD